MRALGVAPSAALALDEAPRLPGSRRWVIPEQRRPLVPPHPLVAIRELSDPPDAAPALPSASSGSDLPRADDRTLALALQSEHPKAPAVAWLRFSPMVRRILRRSFGPGSDVEDLVQDVFLLLFRRVETLREPSTLSAFVIGITVRVAQAELRRRRVRRWVGLSSGPELVDHRTAVDDPDAREALSRFYALLQQINPRDRMAFVLHHIEGLDVATVGAALGVSVPTVRRCLSRAWHRVVLLAGRDPSLADYVSRLRPTGGFRRDPG